ncbi:hypothetical protein PsorP6_001469 [Peronosclerospora sorghi]|uniref:Uncharacterized protein n=1 Tax=Peronosclerospora sorghi TaxID=230839 RepID=A0ACC0WXD5_9STRA|nr:hypothetical protein PsorP6_001469 [Peronosclerospora sorghi]
MMTEGAVPLLWSSFWSTSVTSENNFTPNHDGVSLAPAKLPYAKDKSIFADIVSDDPMATVNPSAAVSSSLSWSDKKWRTSSLVISPVLLVRLLSEFRNREHWKTPNLRTHRVKGVSQNVFGVRSMFVVRDLCAKEKIKKLSDQDLQDQLEILNEINGRT